MKLFCAVVIFVFLVPYSASVYLGLGYLFESIFNIPFIYIMIIMAVLTAAYLMLGGYLGTVISDFVQGLIMLVGIVLCIGYVLASPYVGGLGNGLAQLGEMDVGLSTLFGTPDRLQTLISLILLTSLGAWGLPQMVHKFYAVRDEKAIKQGAVISTFFAAIVAGGAYFIGAFGRLFQNEWAGSADALTGWPLDGAVGNPYMIMPYVFQSAIPELLLSVIVVLILSASMSTLSSVVLTSASAISIDLIKGSLKPKMKDKIVVRLMRVFCGVFVLLSFLIAVLKPGAIVTLMSLSWGTVSGTFLAPFLYGLYWKGVTRAGAWAGMIAGFCCSIGLALWMPNAATQAPLIGAIAMLVSLVAVPLVSLCTQKYDPAHVQMVYAEESKA